MKHLKSRWALAACACLLWAAMPVVAGDRGGGDRPAEGGVKPNGDKPNGNKPAEGQPKPPPLKIIEGTVKAINANSVTIGLGGDKAPKGHEGGDVGTPHEITLDLTTNTKYAEVSGGNAGDLAAGQPVALVLVKLENGIGVKAVATYKGNGAEGQILCQAAAAPMLSALRAASTSGSGDGQKTTQYKSLVGTIDAINGNSLTVASGDHKMTLDIGGAGIAKIDTKLATDVAVGRKVAAACNPGEGGGGKTVSALVMAP